MLGSTNSMRGLGSSENIFTRSSDSRRKEIDNEEVLTWAELEKLPTYDRMRTTILEKMKGSKASWEQVDVGEVDARKWQDLINKVFSLDSPEEDNEKFVLKLRDRINKVNIDLPTVEVRFENLTTEAKGRIGGRSLPTLFNAAINTIEDWLTVMGMPVTKKKAITILHDISGIIKPGRMTLLLGPPRSGKTTLLLALAGNLAKDLKIQGKITYNGHNLDEFVPQKTSAYISQHDIHESAMTVRETMEFAAKCQGVGTRYELLTELAKREKELGIHPEPDVDFFMKALAIKEVSSGIATDYNLKILGLDICADTLVGNQMRRGISGGQKKRVTTGEMVVGPMKTLFMDEISTGLDSSTTYQIVKCLADTSHVLELTIFMSLLQPAPETYDLFDDIVLLSEGQIVYHGPRENVLEFFGSVGYKCPERKGVADFLQEVTSRKDQEQYWSDSSKPYQFTSVKEFGDAFKKFHIGMKIAEGLSIPYERAKSHKAALSFDRYSVSTWDLFKINFSREWLLMKRNSFIYIFRLAQMAIVAVITMSLFFRTAMAHNTLEDAQVYGGAAFFGVVIVMFNGYGELGMTITRLPVFFKQRDLLFFPAWAYSIANIILLIPVSVLESFIWVVISYYTIGFAPAAVRFFRLFFLYVWVHQMSSGMFRLIAGLCRSVVVASTGGSFALVVMFGLGGFLLPKKSIKPWWIWGYWTSPLSYPQNGANVNEFLAPQWNKPYGNSTDSLGVQYLKSLGLSPRLFWYWIAVGVMVGYTFLFNVLFTLSITYLDSPGRTQTADSEDSTDQHQIAGNVSSRKKTIPRSLSLRGASRPRKSGLSTIEGEEELSKANALSSGGESMDIYAGVAPKRGMILPFQPWSISFSDVNYYIDMPAEMKAQGAEENKLQLLQDISGAFRPGVLTALMGVSGAGKTTLMDVLAGRKTGGYIEGDIRISGFPKKQETFTRIAGYCEQDDIHSPQVTVHESLIYSAWLRLPHEVDNETKVQFVEEVMDLVELTPLRDALVGIPGMTGLSTEQRKRLTIAVELVANPSIIFMDEPTSGLDARAAAIVMRTVRNTVDTGRTVVCTIHQPSIDIFEAFDELLLIKPGGRMIYAGPLGHNCCKLVEFFEAIPGVPRIKEGFNPATWMLDVTAPRVEKRLGIDYAEIYAKSSLCETNQALVQRLSTHAPDAKDLYFPSQYSQAFWNQFLSCLWKQRLIYWRNPDYNNVRLFYGAGVAILFGTIFWQIGPKRNDVTNLSSILGAMYGAILFVGINNAIAVQPVVAMERTVFYRERAAGMYSAIPYALAQVFIEIPYNVVLVLIYALITYSMIGFEWTPAKFFWYMYIMFLTFLYFSFYGMMAVGLSPGFQIATIVSSFFFNLFNLFAGFLIPKTRIPKWWRWYYWCNPLSWTFYGLIVSQFGDVHTILDQLQDGQEQTVSQYVEEHFGYKHSFLPVVGVMLVVFPMLFVTIFIVSIKYLNFQTR